MNNDEAMALFLKNDNLKDLQYENGILSYQGKSISLNSLPLNDYFEDTYCQMFVDQKSINALDFFNIMALQAKKVETIAVDNSSTEHLGLIALDYLINNQNKDKEEEKFDVISIDHYFKLLKNTELSSEEQNYLSDFYTHIASLMEYKDYLLNYNADFLKKYESGIINLTFLQEQESNLTTLEKEAINKYQKINADLRSKTENTYKMLKKTNNDASLGYANAFIVVLSVIAVGIVVGMVLFTSLHK